MSRHPNKLSVELIHWNTDTDIRTGCWNWIGSLQTCGYGQIKINGNNWTSHRASWVAHNGAIPNGMHVLHHCDNPKCCNPKHLYLGSHQDNMRDKLQRGRQSKRPGHKLTLSQVLEIKTSSESVRTIAAQYGVSRSHVYAIRGKYPAHVRNGSEREHRKCEIISHMRTTSVASSFEQTLKIVNDFANDGMKYNSTDVP